MFGLKDVLHFGLLIGGELEFLGQFLGALGGIRWTVVPATIVLRGLLIAGRAIVGRLGRRQRHGDRDEASHEKNGKTLFEHGDLLFKTSCLYA